jgi:acetyl esterase/lipase
MTLFGEAWPLTAAELAWRADQLLGPDVDPADPRVSPIKAEDLSRLATAVVVTAGFDPLVDQGEAYAKRLSDAGVKVLYRCYDRLAHDFPVMTGVAPCADLACREIAGLLREGLQHRVELCAA